MAEIFGRGHAVGTDRPRWVYDHEIRSRRSRAGGPGSDAGHLVRPIPMRSLRHRYRELRRAGLSAWQARDIITSILFTGGSSAHWCDQRPVERPIGEVVAGG